MPETNMLLWYPMTWGPLEQASLGCKRRCRFAPDARGLLSHEVHMTESRVIPMKQTWIDVRGAQVPWPAERLTANCWKQRAVRVAVRLSARICCARDRRALSDLLAVYRLHFRWFQVSKLQCTFPSNYLKYRLCDEPLVPEAQLDCVSWVWAREPVHIYEWEHNHEQKHALPQGTWTNYFCRSPLLKIQCTVLPISTASSPSTHVFMWHIANATFLLRVGRVAQSV